MVPEEKSELLPKSKKLTVFKKRGEGEPFKNVTVDNPGKYAISVSKNMLHTGFRG